VSWSQLEARLDRRSAIQKAYAAKGQRIVCRDLDAELPQYLNTGRRNSFAAGFVNWGARGIDDRNVEALQTGCNRSGQSRRTTADHQDIRLRHDSSHVN
jgi:hypothetical protein